MRNKLKPCPNCGKSGKKLIRNRIVFDGTWACKLGKYFIECPSCHWCGKTKVFLWRAILAWNREKKDVNPRNCYNCNHCVYVGEGGYICDMSTDVVIDFWEPTEGFNSCKGKDFENI